MADFHYLRKMFEIFLLESEKNIVNNATDMLRYCEIAKEENRKVSTCIHVDEERKLSPAQCFDGIKNMGMLFCLTPLIRLTRLLAFLWVSIIMGRQYYLDV